MPSDDEAEQRGPELEQELAGEDLAWTSAYTATVEIEAIRTAYDALGTGEVEPLVSLMDEEMEWRGRRGGWRFWRLPPS